MPWEMAMIMMAGFILKHTVMDFWVQNRVPWMWMNKGRFMHPGGLVHAATHAVGSYAVLAPVAGLFEMHRGELFHWERFLWFTLAFEFIVHYFTDYFKMKIGAWRGWECNTSPHFWDLLGLDQLIHMMTYWFIIVGWIGIAVKV